MTTRTDGSTSSLPVWPAFRTTLEPPEVGRGSWTLFTACRVEGESRINYSRITIGDPLDRAAIVAALPRALEALDRFAKEAGSGNSDHPSSRVLRGARAQ